MGAHISIHLQGMSQLEFFFLFGEQKFVIQVYEVGWRLHFTNRKKNLMTSQTNSYKNRPILQTKLLRSQEKAINTHKQAPGSFWIYFQMVIYVQWYETLIN